VGEGNFRNCGVTALVAAIGMKAIGVQLLINFGEFVGYRLSG
jgi:hypothetical protein